MCGNIGFPYKNNNCALVVLCPDLRSSDREGGSARELRREDQVAAPGADPVSRPGFIYTYVYIHVYVYIYIYIYNYDCICFLSSLLAWLGKLNGNSWE